MAFPKFVIRTQPCDPTGRYKTPSTRICGTRDGQRNKYTQAIAGKTRARYISIGGVPVNP